MFESNGNYKLKEKRVPTGFQMRPAGRLNKIPKSKRM